MDFYAILDQVIALLRQRQRVTYRALKVQFQLDDKPSRLSRPKSLTPNASRWRRREVLVWIGDSGTIPLATAISASTHHHAPLTYTPSYLTEKILTSRSAWKVNVSK